MSQYKIKDLIEFKEVVYTEQGGYSIYSYGKIIDVVWKHSMNDEIDYVEIVQIFDVGSYLTHAIKFNTLAQILQTLKIEIWTISTSSLKEMKKLKNYNSLELMT